MMSQHGGISRPVFIISLFFTAILTSLFISSSLTNNGQSHSYPSGSSALGQIHGAHSRVNHMLRQEIKMVRQENEQLTKALLESKAGKSSKDIKKVLETIPHQCPVCPTCDEFIGEDKSANTKKTFKLNPNAVAAMEKYVQLHQDILAGRAPQKFIVARPQAQMNNRLRVIVSAILLGMVTGRAALVDFSSGYYANLDHLFDMPISMDLTKHHPQGDEKYMNMEDVDLLLCSDLTSLSNAVLALSSPPSLIPFFFRNIHHQSLLKQWFDSEEHIYRSLVLFFLRPSAEVTRLKNEFYTAHPEFASSKTNVFRLGIHLRWGGDMRPPVQDHEWKDLVDCTDALVPSNIKGVSRAVAHGAAKENEVKNKLFIFLAADLGETRTRATNLLQARLPGATIVSFKEWLRSNTPAGVQAALTELLLLSETDLLLLTPQSSYGEQAMSIHGKPGFYVKSTVANAPQLQYVAREENIGGVPNCVKVFSSQPSIEGFRNMIKRAKCYHPEMASANF